MGFQGFQLPPMFGIRLEGATKTADYLQDLPANALAVGAGLILVIIALLALTRGATQPVVKIVQPTQQVVKRITRRKK